MWCSLRMAKDGNTDSWWCEPVSSWNVIRATRYKLNDLEINICRLKYHQPVFIAVSCGQAFMKGYPPLLRLVPTGGTVFTSEQEYMEKLDQCCPFTSSK